MTIIVQNLRMLNEGNLKAFVDLAFDTGLILRKCRIIKQPGHRPYLSLPQAAYDTPEGTKKFLTLVTLPRELKLQAQQVALSAWTKVSHEQI